MQNSITPVPTNLITGFLGVGKTTAILNLLRNRPAGAKWAVIVNEYGEVGIDGAILSDAADGSLDIREVEGGCICCTSAEEFNFTLAQVLEHIRPERLLIETTGVGHPARIIEDLQQPKFAKYVDLRATICIVSPSDYTCEPLAESPVFRDQMELADVLLLNKADSTTVDIRERFVKWGRELFPPKYHVAVIEQGAINPTWLDLNHDSGRQAQFPTAHDEHRHASPRMLEFARPGQPVVKPSDGACGWIFSPRDCFDEELLMRLFHQLPNVPRLKGVFRLIDDWIVINRRGNESVSWSTSYRRDSRVEMFCDSPSLDWSAITTRLCDCIMKST